MDSIRLASQSFIHDGGCGKVQLNCISHSNASCWFAESPEGVTNDFLAVRILVNDLSCTMKIRLVMLFDEWRPVCHNRLENIVRCIA